MLLPLLLLEALDGAEPEDCLGAEDDLAADCLEGADLETDEDDLEGEAEELLCTEELLCEGAGDLTSLLLLWAGDVDLTWLLLL